LILCEPSSQFGNNLKAIKNIKEKVKKTEKSGGTKYDESNCLKYLEDMTKDVLEVSKTLQMGRLAPEEIFRTRNFATEVHFRDWDSGFGGEFHSDRHNLSAEGVSKIKSNATSHFRHLMKKYPIDIKIIHSEKGFFGVAIDISKQRLQLEVKGSKRLENLQRQITDISILRNRNVDKLLLCENNARSDYEKQIEHSGGTKCRNCKSSIGKADLECEGHGGYRMAISTKCPYCNALLYPARTIKELNRVYNEGVALREKEKIIEKKIELERISLWRKQAEKSAKLSSSMP